MTINFSNAVWASSNKLNRKATVSEKVDVCITHTTSGNGKKEYMVVRFYAKKFAEVFGNAEFLSIGFLGNYCLLKEGDDYRIYNCSTNPELRVPMDIIEKCGRDASKMYGCYLIKVDESADIAYIDLSIGARA